MTKKQNLVSKNFSIKGWKAGSWLKDNKNTIKLLLSAITGLITPTSPALRTLVALLTKLALDTIDFYVSEVKIE